MALLAMVSVMLHAACFDKENSCDSWAEGGECEKNAAFMKDACPLACQICTPPPPVDERDDPLLGRERAVMTTEYGEIVLGFYPTVAPKTVAHIIKLFRMGGYNTNHVFRVDKGFVAQVQGVDGGRRATMSKALRHEAKKNVPDEFSGTPSSKFPDVKHVRGMLSMGKFDEPGSGTSSFSMLLGNAPFLDGKYTIFGRVVSGDQARAAHVHTKLLRGGGPPVTASSGGEWQVLSRLEALETKREGIFVMPKVHAHDTYTCCMHTHARAHARTAWAPHGHRMRMCACACACALRALRLRYTTRSGSRSSPPRS